MARCGTCHGEFEGARQPNCPLCGAQRPRPKLRPVPPRPDPVADLPVDATEGSAPRMRRRERRRAARTGPPPLAIVLPATTPVPVDPAPAGPPPIEVEYVFGTDADEIVLLTTVAVLPAVDDEEDH